METVGGAGEPLCMDGPSPEGAREPALNLPLGPCTPRPRTPSPASAPQGLAESSGRLSLSPTVTTPSLPAEVGSPHSTEVDESLSVSFEQALPPPGGDAGLSLPLRGPLAQRSASPHDVDLCLVSPCEFQHRRAVPLVPASPGSSDGSSARSQERAGPPGPEETPPSSVSESLPTLSDSDLLPAQGPADSDDDTEGFAIPQRDPLPDPLKFPPPLPTPPSICMVDPEMLTRRPASQPDSRSRKSLSRPHSSLAAPKAAPVTTAKNKGPTGVERGSRPLSSRSESSVQGSRASLSRKASVTKTTPRGPGGPAGSRSIGSSGSPGCPIYLDLAYLPGGGSAHLLDEEFFRRVRALCYVISGQDQRREEGLRAVLDALLAAKQQWERDLQVTLIPTFDSVAMHEWYEETHAQHSALGITVLGSNSTVSMQDEAFPACKVEF